MENPKWTSLQGKSTNHLCTSKYDNYLHLMKHFPICGATYGFSENGYHTKKKCKKCETISQTLSQH